MKELLEICGFVLVMMFIGAMWLASEFCSREKAKTEAQMAAYHDEWEENLRKISGDE